MSWRRVLCILRPICNECYDNSWYFPSPSPYRSITRFSDSPVHDGKPARWKTLFKWLRTTAKSEWRWAAIGACVESQNHWSAAVIISWKFNGKIFFGKKKKIQRFEQFISRENCIIRHQMKYLLTGSAVQATIYCLFWSKIVSLSCINKSRFEVYLYFDHFLITSLRFCCNIFSTQFDQFMFFYISSCREEENYLQGRGSSAFFRHELTLMSHFATSNIVTFI